ncbi:cryptochrome/photolyase family protein [Ferruginibacter yonginensis]|uniref:Cryptochrome/photolyase family protein n=1 Tax=Ferruginibacter yonginensis TaxID=1310416 RepID=A0ABV8QQA5_9BACT
MTAVSLIFPHQLFNLKKIAPLQQRVVLVEEALFFTQYNFHQQKLVFHRASMKQYAAHLTENGYNVLYINSNEPIHDISKLIPHLKKSLKVTDIHFTEVVDNWLYRRLKNACKKQQIQLHQHTTPAFLNTLQEGNQFFDSKKRYFQTDFYIHQRKTRGILLDDGGQPVGGQWSYDADNRKKYPSSEKPPKLAFPSTNTFVKEALQYVATNFGNNYGVTTNFIYPINEQDALHWLKDFLQHRFEKFGVYEDALVANEHYLHHSLLSPLLNAGLLTPQQIIDTTLQFAAKHQIPLNSTEGFIRQIIGWREFIRMVYEREGSKQRTTNYWGFTRKIPATFWTGNTGITPIDNVIKKVLQTGYLHHIERLMLLGNFMLLCEFDPDEVYRWFMELFIDSYDWVMVPNVYGMVQFADGGLMTTKPYISGSNYITKMSDYKKGEWTSIWDALFWRFMHTQRTFFSKNPRLGMLLKTFDKMDATKRNQLLTTADAYLASLDDAFEKK